MKNLKVTVFLAMFVVLAVYSCTTLDGVDSEPVSIESIVDSDLPTTTRSSSSSCMCTVDWSLELIPNPAPGATCPLLQVTINGLECDTEEECSPRSFQIFGDAINNSNNLLLGDISTDNGATLSSINPSVDVVNSSGFPLVFVQSYTDTPGSDFNAEVCINAVAFCPCPLDEEEFCKTIRVACE